MNQAALHDAVMRVHASMETRVNLGRMREFKNIRIEALKLGLWVCSNMVCVNPVKDVAEFGFRGSQVLPQECKECANKYERSEKWVYK